MADKVELDANEIKLGETSARYQSPVNTGTFTLTSRRLVWRKGWMLTPLSLLGQREAIIPIERIEKCFSRGIMVVVGTQNGDFYFYFWNRWWSPWWDDRKAKEWLALIEDAMLHRLHTA